VTTYPYLVAGVQFLAGLYGVVTSRNYIHLAVCLTVMQSATYVALIAVGYVRGGQAPITKGAQPGKPFVDPLVQSLTLTDVVVSVAVLALVLSLALRAHETHGTLDPDEMREMRG
jgi:multicomponent Na+:H+ antiporter subunit C